MTRPLRFIVATLAALFLVLASPTLAGATGPSVSVTFSSSQRCPSVCLAYSLGPTHRLDQARHPSVTVLLYRDLAARGTWVSIRVRPAYLGSHRYRVTRAIPGACESRYGVKNSVQLEVRYSDRSMTTFAIPVAHLPACPGV